MFFCLSQTKEKSNDSYHHHLQLSTPLSSPPFPSSLGGEELSQLTVGGLWDTGHLEVNCPK